MQVAAAALLFYLSIDKRLLFLPNSGSSATFQVAGAQLWILKVYRTPVSNHRLPLSTAFVIVYCLRHRFT